MWALDYRSIHKRLIWVALLVAVGLGVLAWRAYSLQVTQGEKHYKMAKQQTLGSIVIQPRRGDILDRNGRVLATNKSVQSIAARPRIMSMAEKETTKRVISNLFKADNSVLSRLDQPRSFVWLYRRLTEEQSLAYDTVFKALPETLRPKGLQVVEEDKRYYPGNELAAPILGLTDIDLKGQFGLEALFNRELSGEALEVKGVRDPSGQKVTLEALDLTQDVPLGDHLQLTIDRLFQYVAEREVAKAVQEHRASYGVAIALDVTNGDVLAMAQYPSYNPNLIEKMKPEALHNVAVEWTVEPGSTLKPFVVAASLEEGLHKPTDSIFCGNGAMQIGPNVIHDSHAHGDLTIAQIVSKSSNIGTAKFGMELGAERLYRYLDSFGFGRKTGIVLPAESAGLLAKPQRWHPIELATISFGQGLNVTPLQLATAFAAIANGGELRPPRIVDKLIAPDGSTRKVFEALPPHRVISKKTADQMNTIMQGVLEEGGTASSIRIGGCPIAAKTGTAQKLAKNHKLGGEFWTSVFAGFFPADDPKVSLMVVIDEPTDGKYYGGEVAAPAFRAIVSEVAPQMGVCTRSPDERAEVKKK